jgi:hypothetical protein
MVHGKHSETRAPKRGLQSDSPKRIIMSQPLYVRVHPKLGSCALTGYCGQIDTTNGGGGVISSAAKATTM